MTSSPSSADRSPAPGRPAPSGTRTVRAAAVDCGTNSVRLLVADVTLRSGRVTAVEDLARDMTITRLGRGVDRTGRFDPDALAATLAAVEDYAARCRDLGVAEGFVRMVATSASRDAANREEFFSGVRAHLGLDPEVISGDDEAALSFAGAASGLGGRVDSPVLVVDIGGGSTELVLGDPTSGVTALVSTDVGSVRLTERHMHADPPTSEQLQAARADVRAALDQAAQVVDLGAARTLVGLAGSVTTLAALALGLAAYDREAVDGTTLPLKDWTAACDAMIAAPRPQREAMGFLHPGRVEVIAAGSVVWQEVLARVAAETARAGAPISTATVSEHDILDGIVREVALRVTS